MERNFWEKCGYVGQDGKPHDAIRLQSFVASVLPALEKQIFSVTKVRSAVSEVSKVSKVSKLVKLSKMTSKVGDNDMESIRDKLFLALTTLFVPALILSDMIHHRIMPNQCARAHSTRGVPTLS